MPKPRPIISPTFAQCPDGLAVAGLREGVWPVPGPMLAAVIEMSLDYRLWPYRITRLERYDPQTGTHYLRLEPEPPARRK